MIRRFIGRIFISSLIVTISICGINLKANDEELVLHVPKMEKVPVIDGIIQPNEWREASAINSFRGAISKTAYPDKLRMVWYLGYDDKNLYLAMHAIFPESISLKAEAKKHDDSWTILRDDHVEIQLSSVGRKKAKTQGYGFYKIMANPRGFFSDTWYYCGTPGNEDLWSSGAVLKSSNTKNSWTIEIKWPLESVKIKKADNASLIMLFSRAVSGVGWYFASSSPGIWESWNEFYRVILDPEAPATQFLKKGDIVNGELDTEIKIYSKKPITIDADLKIRDAAGKLIFKDQKQVALLKDQPGQIVFKNEGKLPISEKGNSYKLEIRSGSELLYNTTIPFVEYTDDYVSNNLTSWLESRPKLGEYKTAAAYYPTTGKLGVKVDLDVFGGLPDKFAGVSQFKAEIRNLKNNKILKSKVFSITELAGEGVMETGSLPEGKYVCEISLLNNNNKVIDFRKSEFTRKNYEWEGNKIGTERIVIPLFTPLEFGPENRIKTCKSEFKIGEGGLFDSIKHNGKELLASPVRIEADFGNKKEVWNRKKVEITPGKGKTFPKDFVKYAWTKKCPKLTYDQLEDTDGYEAIVKAESEAGPMDISVNGTMDYDGYYRVKIKYAPKAGKSVELDSLDVVLELGKWADTMVAGRDIYAACAATVLPEKDGVVWQSTDNSFRPNDFKGFWVPFAYLGNGGTGIWYLGESDRGWILDDNKPSLFIERVNGNPVMRLRLVNTKTTLDKASEAEFVLQVVPSKLEPPNARYRQWQAGCPSGVAEDKVVWFNSGWRIYGWSGDGFYLPSDEEFKALGNWIKYPEKATGYGKNWWSNYLLTRKKKMGEKAWLEEAPVVIYSSYNNFSPALPELETFGGEWAGKNDLVPGKDYGYNKERLGKWRNYTGTCVFDTPAKLGEIQGIWNQSLIDCYIWYIKKLLELAEINGTYYDNAGMIFYENVNAGVGYVRRDGHKQPQSSLFVRRQVTKRLNTLAWLLGQPPLFYPNAGTFTFSFTQKMIGIEGDWYIWNLNGTMMDANKINSLRALSAKGTKMCLATGLEARYPDGSAGIPHRPMRSVFAIAILFDFSATRLNWDKWQVEQIFKLLDKIGFMDKEHQAEFLPFWGNKEYVSFVKKKEGSKEYECFVPKHVFCSIYRQHDKAMLWLVNDSDEIKAYDIKVDAKKIIGKKAKSLTDMETGEPMSLIRNKKDIWAHIYVPPKNFRALMLK